MSLMDPNEQPSVAGVSIPRELYWAFAAPAPLAGMRKPRSAFPWQSLARTGFSWVVSLDTCEYDPAPLRVLCHESLQDLNDGDPPTEAEKERSKILRVTDCIIEKLHAGQGVVLHCFGGRGRTGTVLGCVLRHFGYSSDEVIAWLDRVHKARGKRGWPESSWQEQVVRSILIVGDTMEYKIIIDRHKYYTTKIKQKFQQDHWRLNAKAKHPSLIPNVMPLTWVGERYGKPFKGSCIPRVLILAMNQSRKGQDGLTAEVVSESLAPQREDGLYTPAGYGPRALAANLTRWLYGCCGIKPSCLSPEDIFRHFAYDNYVKWAFNAPSSEPPQDAWTIFQPLNQAIIEILQPDIILAIGGLPFSHIRDCGQFTPYPHLEEWLGTLTLASQHDVYVGKCYHYSRTWCRNKSTKPVEQLLSATGGAWGCFPEDEPHLSLSSDWWWGRDTFTGRFSDYCNMDKRVAFRICRTVVDKWKKCKGTFA